MPAKPKFRRRSGRLSTAQISMYWRLWKSVCIANSWKQNDDDRRYAFHARARCPQSMKDFDNNSLDAFKKLALHLTGKPSGNDEAGARRRLVWRIKEDASKTGLDEAYIATVSTDLYGLACWDLLALDDLTNLRDVIHNRASTRLGHDTRTFGKSRKYTPNPTKTFTPAPNLETQPF